MRRPLLLILILLISKIAICQQTKATSFEVRFKPGYQGLSQNQIIADITNSQFENFRLLNTQIRLNFDNGFDIILLSANELQKLGIINTVSGYQTDFPPNYKLPVFHINQSGQVAAEYPVSKNVKFSRVKR